MAENNMALDLSQIKAKATVLETIRICRDRDILKEYLENCEKEVIGIMKSLFDQEKIMEQYIGELMEEYGGERERNGEKKNAEKLSNQCQNFFLSKK